MRTILYPWGRLPVASIRHLPIDSPVAGFAAATFAARTTLERQLEGQCACEEEEKDALGGRSPSTSDQSPQVASLNRFAAKVIDHPLLMDKLGQRVYQLLQADLQQQRERNGYYGRR